METFDAYLLKKKINPQLFAQAEPQTFAELQSIFDQMHPNSFTMQKLFILNKLRKLYHAP